MVSVSADPLEIWYVEAAEALVIWAKDLKAEDLLSPLHLMCVFKKLNLA